MRKMIYFTSDTHFNHSNLIEKQPRPFGDGAEMTETLIANWNDRVRPQDSVYHLGDFALSWGSKHKQCIEDIYTRLNGQKFLIKGNHDRKEVIDLPWQFVRDYYEIKVDLGGVHKQRIVLSHYAFKVWNQSHRGAWMLHGHSHGNLEHGPYGKIADVGVDCWDYAPVSLEEVSAYMQSRDKFPPVDHHI